VPPSLLWHLKHSRALQRHVFILTVVTEPIPWIAPAKHLTVTPLAENVWRGKARFGFMQRPDVPALLAQALGRIDKIAEAMPDPAIATPPTPIAVIAPQQLVEQTPDGISPGDPGIGAPGSVNDGRVGLPRNSADSAKGDHPPLRRQHGGALPRSDS
jgi:hypothetical protein